MTLVATGTFKMTHWAAEYRFYENRGYARLLRAASTSRLPSSACSRRHQNDPKRLTGEIPAARRPAPAIHLPLSSNSRRFRCLKARTTLGYEGALSGVAWLSSDCRHGPDLRRAPPHNEMVVSPASLLTPSNRCVRRPRRAQLPQVLPGHVAADRRRLPVLPGAGARRRGGASTNHGARHSQPNLIR